MGQPGSTADRSARRGRAALAVIAGLLHFRVAPEHVREAFEAGLFMVAVGVLRVAAGLLLVVRPSRRRVAATILGTLLVFVVHAASRTVGPPLGAEPRRSEEVGAIDVVSKATELALLAALLVLARRIPAGDDAEPRGRGSGFPGGRRGDAPFASARPTP